MSLDATFLLAWSLAFLYHAVLWYRSSNALVSEDEDLSNGEAAENEDVVKGEAVKDMDDLGDDMQKMAFKSISLS